MKQSTTLQRISVVISASLIAGCAQVPQYQDASGPETAKLRLRMQQPIVSNLFLDAIEADTCKSKSTFSWLAGGVDSLYTKRVGMLESMPPAEGVLEYVVPANRPIAAFTTIHLAKLNAAEIMFSMNPVMQSEIAKKQPIACPAPAFLPRSSEQYEMVFSAKPGECTTTIYQLKMNGDKVERVDITNELNIAVKFRDGRFMCEAP